MKLVKLANANGLTRAVSKAVCRTGLKIRKYSPEILITAGIAGGVTAAVLACKATLRVDEVMMDHMDDLDKIKEASAMAKEGKVEYTEQDERRDKVIVYAHMVLDLVKLYGPSIVAGGLSVAFILSGYGIIKKRQIALIGALNSVTEAFEKYRKRIVEDHGEEYDDDVYHGRRRGTVKAVEIDEEGKEKEVEKKVVDTNLKGMPSQYARIFDETNPIWKKNADMNLLFIRAQQNYANELLMARGHVFLNEVYDSLGFERTPAGAVTGWVLQPGKTSYVDFGIYNLENARFVNGQERSILLDFNVDGVIYDLI